MIILDENIIAWQSDRLRALRIHYRQIGVGIGRKGMKDRNQIIPLLHSLRRPTFFTRDHDFYKPGLRHSGYCLVYLDILPDEVAEYSHRFLRHTAFRTQAKRMGTVVRLRRSSVNYWQAGSEEERTISW